MNKNLLKATVALTSVTIVTSLFAAIIYNKKINKKTQLLDREIILRKNSDSLITRAESTISKFHKLDKDEEMIDLYEDWNKFSHLLSDLETELEKFKILTKGIEYKDQDSLDILETLNLGFYEFFKRNVYEICDIFEDEED